MRGFLGRNPTIPPTFIYIVIKKDKRFIYGLKPIGFSLKRTKKDLEGKLDNLVYELYGLNDKKDIKIVTEFLDTF